MNHKKELVRSLWVVDTAINRNQPPESGTERRRRRRRRRRPCHCLRRRCGRP